MNTVIYSKEGKQIAIEDVTSISFRFHENLAFLYIGNAREGMPIPADSILFIIERI